MTKETIKLLGAPISTIFSSEYIGQKIIETGTGMLWNKLKSKIKRENNAVGEGVFDAIEHSVEVYAHTNDKNVIAACSEKLYFEWVKNKCLDDDSIKKALSMFSADPIGEIQIENWKGFFDREIIKNVELRKWINHKNIENINEKINAVYKNVEAEKKFFQLYIDRQDEIGDKLIKKINKMSPNVAQKSINCVKKVSDRSKQYAEIWNQNMFLNNFGKRDENAGVNIQLKELYKEKCLPHYIWKNNNRECCDLAELLQEYICEYRENKLLLIKGQSGVGKSTLITWILNKYEEFKDNIYVYSFASDLQNIRWDETKKNYIINNILDELDIIYDGLDGKTLILDGFDEINVKGSRSEILNDIYQEIHGITNVYGFSVIITCRENYIENDNDIMCDYITLCPFDEKQIKEFCKAFEYKTCSEISSSMFRSIIANKEIFGIPLILYMTLALDISIDNESSIVGIYDKIFSTNNGSIYNRCIDNKNYGDKHRISILKEQIHQISRDIAMWMFENRPFEAVIPKIEYDKICDNNINRIKFNPQDVAIGNYFELVHHTDGMGGQEICFIHRSIYEYFIVDAIFSNIEEYMLELTEENKEKVAKSIAISLKKGLIKKTIINYFEYKMKKFVMNKYKGNIEKFYEWWEDIFIKMLDKGMLYYTRENINCFENIIDKEIIIFSNMTKIIRMVFLICSNTETDDNIHIKYIMENKNKSSLIKYIGYYSHSTRNLFEPMDLSFFSLKMIELNYVNASSWNFDNTDLTGSYFEKVELINASFKNANMTEMDLSHCRDIFAINIANAVINETLFNEDIIKWLEIEFDLTGIRIANLKHECINYDDYKNGYNDRWYRYGNDIILL